MTAIKGPSAGWSAHLCEVLRLARHDLLLLCMACSLVFTKIVGWLVGWLDRSLTAFDFALTICFICSFGCSCELRTRVILKLVSPDPNS